MAKNMAKKNEKGELELTTVFTAEEAIGRRNMLISEITELTGVLAFKKAMLRDINLALGKQEADDKQELPTEAKK